MDRIIDAEWARFMALARQRAAGPGWQVWRGRWIDPADILERPAGLPGWCGSTARPGRPGPRSPRATTATPAHRWPCSSSTTGAPSPGHRPRTTGSTRRGGSSKQLPRAPHARRPRRGAPWPRRGVRGGRHGVRPPTPSEPSERPGEGPDAAGATRPRILVRGRSIPSTCKAFVCASSDDDFRRTDEADHHRRPDRVIDRARPRLTGGHPGVPALGWADS